MTELQIVPLGDSTKDWQEFQRKLGLNGDGIRLEAVLFEERVRIEHVVKRVADGDTAPFFVARGGDRWTQIKCELRWEKRQGRYLVQRDQERRPVGVNLRSAGTRAGSSAPIVTSDWFADTLDQAFADWITSPAGALVRAETLHANRQLTFERCASQLADATARHDKAQQEMLAAAAVLQAAKQSAAALATPMQTPAGTLSPLDQLLACVEA